MSARSLRSVSHDVWLALRTVRRAPGFTATIALTLALGIGANAAIFGVINSLLLRPLPVAYPHRLVTISSDAAIARGQAGVPWSFAMWEELQPHASLFDGAFAWTPARFDLAERGERQPVTGIFASGGYFETLGVAAIRGRTFTAADDRAGGGADGVVAVISYGLWQRRFEGADIIGAPLVVDGATVTIVGVTPPEFRGLDVGSVFDVALPLETEPLIRGSRSALQRTRLVVMLRMKPGQSVEAGTATLRGLQPQLGSTAAPNREPFTLAPAATGASLPVRGPHGLRQSYARPLLTILMVALLVLLIACVNIANLLLARASARRYELGVRLALGASRGRLARQLLIENLIFAMLGAMGALVIAQWSSKALAGQLSTPVQQIALDLSFDWRVMAFTAAVALVTASTFGTVPAFRATRIDPLAVFKGRSQADSSFAAGTRGLATASSGLVILQIALSLVLVICAALLVRSFARLASVPLGFDPDRVLVVDVETERVRTDAEGRMRLFHRILDAVRSVPGVLHAGGSIWTPIDGGMRMGDSESRIAFNFVTSGWFAAYGTALRAGRDFTAGDTAGSAPVVIVNDAFVRAFMAGASPLGETIPHPRSRPEVLRTVVGVVDDAVFDSQREGIQPIVYLPVAQSGGGRGGRTAISLGVRPAAGAPVRLAPSVAAAVRRVSPDVSFSFGLLEAHAQASVRQERLVALLSAFFGALALVIAALGVYGVTSYTVNRRVTEIGIRRALGAQRAHVLRLVFGRSLTVTCVGIGLGLAGAAAVTRALRGLLFGLTPLDPGTFIGVGALFVIVATLATLVPAHRASKVDPLVALRNE